MGSRSQAEAPDDYTVVMQLPRPFAPLFYSIGFGSSRAHVLEAAYNAGNFNHTWGIDTPPDKLVSLGTYQMERYVPAQQMAFKRYPAYWMRDEQGGRAAAAARTGAADRAGSECSVSAFLSRD